MKHEPGGPAAEGPPSTPPGPVRSVSAAASSRRMIGRGRSAEVWLVEDAAGRRVEKIFAGDALGTLVQRAVIGAANPYRWNEDMVRAALERRRILAALLPWWFDGKVAMAEGREVLWLEDRRAYALVCDVAPGGAVPLLHPLRPEADAALRLSHEIVPALVERLVESGFFGLVWQAGLGNPKALPNYLYDAATDRYTFVDGESGVPALFATSPAAVLRFYLPRTLRLGRPMLDDVDCAALRDYLRRHAAALAEREGGPRGVAALLAATDRIDAAQRRWLALSRSARRRAWRARVGAPPPRPSVPKRAGAGIAQAADWLARRLGPAGWGTAWRFARSQSYRTALGESYVRSRIERWRARGQFDEGEAARLDRCLDREREAGRYLTDFGAHLGMKASFFTLEVTLLVALSLLGVPLYLLGLVFVIDGPLYRTAYSAWRSVQNLTAGRPVLWTALAVGLVPFFGSLAFPAQMLWSASGRGDAVAKFVVYDSFSRLAAAVPLVGGEDTALEHRLNRLARRIVGG